jgi:hypothetical protein
VAGHTPDRLGPVPSTPPRRAACSGLLAACRSERRHIHDRPAHSSSTSPTAAPWNPPAIRPHTSPHAHAGPEAGRPARPRALRCAGGQRYRPCRTADGRGRALQHPARYLRACMAVPMKPVREKKKEKPGTGVDPGRRGWPDLDCRLPVKRHRSRPRPHPQAAAPVFASAVWPVVGPSYRS